MYNLLFSRLPHDFTPHFVDLLVCSSIQLLHYFFKVFSFKSVRQSVGPVLWVEKWENKHFWMLSAYELVCIVSWGVGWGWMPLPTHLRRYCNLASLVLLFDLTTLPQMIKWTQIWPLPTINPALLTLEPKEKNFTSKFFCKNSFYQNFFFSKSLSKFFFAKIFFY